MCTIKTDNCSHLTCFSVYFFFCKSVFKQSFVGSADFKASRHQVKNAAFGTCCLQS